MKAMKSLGVASVLLMLAPLCAQSDNQSPVLYAEDFASEPGWTTDDPSGLRYDPTSQTYLGRQVNTEGTVAYVDLPGFAPNRSWHLEFDYLVQSVDWSAGFTVGLFDGRLRYPFGVGLDIGLVDGGRVTSAWAGGLNLISRYNPPWQLDVWYHAAIDFDQATGELSVRVTERDTGTVHFETINQTGPLPADTTKFGVSRLHMKNTGPGASPSAAVQFKLDNVLVSQACDSADTPDLLDVAVSTRASQASVDSLAAAVDAIDLSNLDEAVSSRASQSSVDALASAVSTLDLSNLDAPVSTRATQTSVDALGGQLAQAEGELVSLIATRASQVAVNALMTAVNGTATQSSLDALATAVAAIDLSHLDVAVSTRASQADLDALTAGLESHRSEVLTSMGWTITLLIESRLAEHGPALASLYLPEAHGGQLELVRAHVAYIIQMHQDAGITENVEKATNELMRGDELSAAGHYQLAFEYYGRSYRTITKPVGYEKAKDDRESKGKRDKDED